MPFRFLKVFVTDFSEPKKARKLKVHINMDSDWMYRVYQNKSQGFILFKVVSLGRFSKKLKDILHVCSPTSMKLIPHFVDVVAK